jgi:hypothetical protein
LLRELRISGFKAFSDWEVLEVRPITLIYGQNSSGKSSILQSILLLKQSIEQAENPEAILSPTGELVNLGSFREFVHMHDTRKAVALRFTMDWKPEQSNGWTPLLPKLIKKTVGLEVGFAHDEETDSTHLTGIQAFADHFEESAIAFLPVGRAERPQKLQIFGLGGARSSSRLLRVGRANFEHPFWKEVLEFRKESDPYIALRRELPSLKKQLSKLEFQGAAPTNRDESGRLRAVEKQKQSLKKRIEAIEKRVRDSNETVESGLKDFENANSHSYLSCRNFLPWEFGMDDDDFSMVVSELSAGSQLALASASVLRTLLQQLIYIGPLRDVPKRHNIFSGTFSEYVGKTGLLLPQILYGNRKLLDKVNEQFDNFDLGYRLEISSASKKSELQDVFALRLMDRLQGVNVSIVDVGFGISQILPVVVQSMLSTGKTLLIEQPEIHLHPRLQAELGALFVQTIKPPYNNSFIIETHSEHLLLRLQKMIRQGQLTPQDVSVIYVDRNQDGSRCLKMNLGPNGEFQDQWPQGFFEESYREIFS